MIIIIIIIMIIEKGRSRQFIGKVKAQRDYC